MDEGERLIRDIWGRWNAGERDLAPDVDPDLEIRSTLAGRTYRGEAEVREWIAEIDEQFESWTLGLDRVEKAGPDRFLAVGSIRARGRQSGVDLDQPLTWAIELRDGRMTRMEAFWGADSYEAAKAALEA